MKKGVFVFFLILLLVSPFVAATVEDVLDRAAYSISPVVGWLIGDVYDGELLLVKFLVFLIILSLVHFSLKRTPFGEDGKMVGIISIIVAILSVRYMTSEAWINFIWLPYGGLGVLFASLLPFVIFFFFIESFGEPLIRKIGWVAFAAIYAGLAYVKWDDFYIGPEWWQNLAMIYAVIALISLGIILFEKSLRYGLMMSAIRKGNDPANIILRDGLMKDLEKINNTLASTHLPRGAAAKLNARKKKIMKAIARIG